MAYTKNEKGDAPKMRRGGRRRKKVCVFRKLCKASESAHSGDQESKTRGSYAVYSRVRTTFWAPPVRCSFYIMKAAASDENAAKSSAAGSMIYCLSVGGVDGIMFR